MWQVNKVLCFVLFFTAIFLVHSAAANPITPPPVFNYLNPTLITEKPLVENATVTVIATDFWKSGALVWQLTTTDTIPSTNTWTDWENNECSANNPLANGYQIVFAVDATAASTDNKLQKLMTLLQVAQLTGMQVTLEVAPFV